jgi:hypothetical protein
MNGDTLNLIERPYQEVVDDLLTAMVGGVVNEPILYDLKADLYPLAEPASGVRGVTGTAAERHHAFLPGVDFELSEGDNALVWTEDGTRPDDETTFYVDYFRREGRSPLSDINVGSVARTLGEAIGREIATLYQQVNLAYLSGFIDTAEGRSLDFVVSILGVERKTSEHAEGLVTFYRDPEVAGNVTIAQGTRLATAKGEALFETSQLRTLQRGQARIDVPVRAAPEFGGEAGLVGAGEITEMVQPVAGIARVTNLEPTARAAEDETDEELRARARAALRALGKATLAALDRVIREGRGTPLEFWDPNGPPDKRTDAGSVAVLLEAEPERFPGLRAAVEETRAAGVLATVTARYVFFKPRRTAKLAGEITGAGKEKVQDEVIAALQGYVDGLTAGQPALGAAMLAAIAENVPDAKEPVIKDVLVWRADVGRPGPEALVETLVRALAGAPMDEAGLRAALAAALTEPPPTAPSGARIPDRSLLQAAGDAAEGGAAAGGPASDEQIESGEFRVSAQVDGEPWFVVLDMERADVVLEEA